MGESEFSRPPIGELSCFDGDRIVGGYEIGIDGQVDRARGAKKTGLSQAVDFGLEW